MIRAILRHGTPPLHAPAETVRAITPDVQQLIDDMIETMHAAPGVGLAAPQVGVGQRICVIDLSVGARPSELHVLINPELLVRDGLQLENEGCLSLPGFTATVPRPAHVAVRALDRTGRLREVEGTGLLARALQHEMDHLEGRLYVSRLPRMRRGVLLRRLRWLHSRGEW
jgi:peptide deformylase